ncbi:hypothetical protein [Vibrio mediterranei]|uniref:Uncharacterized protein n=1 Tax=Vibrio mediterranei TaxID=689 RepID=A0AAN1FKC5_9VIBR|nr:hypothetical protein [Vibrio mediterranei]ASI92194.1 hypothetical protein BSZ05_20505 [Vibrio mediterranei]
MVQQDAHIALLSVVILIAPMLLSWNRSNRMMVIGFNMLGVICIAAAYHYCYHPLVYLPFFMSGLTCWMFAVGFAVNNR